MAAGPLLGRGAGRGCLTHSSSGPRATSQGCPARLPSASRGSVWATHRGRALRGRWLAGWLLWLVICPWSCVRRLGEQGLWRLWRSAAVPGGGCHGAEDGVCCQARGSSLAASLTGLQGERLPGACPGPCLLFPGQPGSAIGLTFCAARRRLTPGVRHPSPKGGWPLPRVLRAWSSGAPGSPPTAVGCRRAPAPVGPAATRETENRCVPITLVTQQTTGARPEPGQACA